MNFDEMKEKLEKYQQQHVLSAYFRADDATKAILMQQVERIDFAQLQSLYQMARQGVTIEEATIEPLPCMDASHLSEEEKNQYLHAGEEVIRAKKLAAVTMAGGQGTRLGHHGPKGTFDLGLSSHKSLFEILNDGLKEACQKYHTEIPWYIMTSHENHESTVRFFEEHHYFGYPQENIFFFPQGELPMLDEAGKVIINEEGIIKEAADGHGGVFGAMFHQHVLEDMKRRGIEWVFVGGVDNPLVKMADPLFIGYAESQHVLAASKTLVKAYPEEKIGVFCKKDGKPYVIEYTEISKEMAEAKDEKGEYLYGEGHVLLNMFHINALEKIQEVKLPYHSAHKKANMIDENGNLVVPEKPNAYKFEAFLFDAFSLMPTIALMRGKREDDFAPVKNAEGNDSPETARKLYEDFERRNRLSHPE